MVSGDAAVDVCLDVLEAPAAAADVRPTSGTLPTQAVSILCVTGFEMD